MSRIYFFRMPETLSPWRDLLFCLIIMSRHSAHISGVANSRQKTQAIVGISIIYITSALVTSQAIVSVTISYEYWASRCKAGQ